MSFLRQNLLVILTLGGCCAGFLISILVKYEDPSESAIMWIGLPGELYIRLIKVMVIPLVICSIIAGTAKMDPRTNGKVSGMFFTYIMVTNLLTPVFAAALSYLIKPGVGIESDGDISQFSDSVMKTEDIFADLLRNIVPDNIAAACFQQTQTKYEHHNKTSVYNNGTHNFTQTKMELTRKITGSTESPNIIGLIILSVLFGIGTASMKEKGEPFLLFFKSASDIILKILGVLIWTTPVGVASLIAKTIISTDDVNATFRKLGLYFLTVNLGLFVWGFIIIPVVFFVILRSNPFKFYGSIMPSIMIVIVTTSDMIALPETLDSLENKNGCDPRITRLVAPLAAAIGRAGSAFYITCSCFFIIQAQGQNINAADAFVIVLLTWISALAIPSVTGASLVTALILLSALNVPGEAAAMLFAFEFFLDRFRSVVNLLTELTGVMFVNKVCTDSLQMVSNSTVIKDCTKCNAEKKENSCGQIDAKV